MKLLTDRQETLIYNNVIRACENPFKLNNTGYKFLHLCSGFIAHYDLHGFRDYYSRNSLMDDILRNESANQWQNFRIGDRDYEYYRQKNELYSRICRTVSYMKRHEND